MSKTEWLISQNARHRLPSDGELDTSQVRGMAACEASAIVADILEPRSWIENGRVVISRDALHLLALRIEQIAAYGLVPADGDLGDGMGPHDTANPRHGAKP
jgi:hypothetical protein